MYLVSGFGCRLLRVNDLGYCFGWLWSGRWAWFAVVCRSHGGEFPATGSSRLMGYAVVSCGAAFASSNGVKTVPAHLRLSIRRFLCTRAVVPLQRALCEQGAANASESTIDDTSDGLGLSCHAMTHRKPISCCAGDGNRNARRDKTGATKDANQCCGWRWRSFFLLDAAAAPCGGGYGNIGCI